MGGDAHLAALPLRQYEVALQHAGKVLASLLQQPVKPWICFAGSIRQIGEQSQALRERAAICTIQRAFRRHRNSRVQQASARPVTELASKQGLESSRAPGEESKLTAAGAHDTAKATANTQALEMENRSVADSVSHQQPEALTASKASKASTPKSKPAAPSKPSGVQDTGEIAAKKQLQSEVSAAGQMVKRPEAAQPPIARPPPVPMPHRPLESSGALNPIEKRRQMIASQLALANPSRLSRNRRLQIEQLNRSSTTDTDTKSLTAAATGSAMAKSPRHCDVQKTSVIAAQIGGSVQNSPRQSSQGRATSAARDDSKGSPPQVSSSCSAAETGGFCGGADVFSLEFIAGIDDYDDELECSTGGTPVSPGRRCPSSQEAADARRECCTPVPSAPSSFSTSAQCISPRRPPMPQGNVAPRPGSHGNSRGPPVDLLLKDNLPEDDPLELAGASMGCSVGQFQALSMAPPPSSSRPQSPRCYPAPLQHRSLGVGQPSAAQSSRKHLDKHVEDDLKFYNGGIEVNTPSQTGISTAAPSATASGFTSPECLLSSMSGPLGARQFGAT